MLRINSARSFLSKSNIGVVESGNCQFFFLLLPANVKGMDYLHWNYAVENCRNQIA